MTDTPAHKPRSIGTALYAFSIFVLAALVLVLVYTINNRIPSLPIPNPKMPRPNAYDDFVSADKLLTAKSISGMGPYSSSRQLNSCTAPELHSFVVSNEAALQLIRASLKKTYLYPPARSFNTLFPVLSSFRESARTMRSVAYYYRVTHQPAKAADSLLDCIEYGVMIPRGGGIIVSLAGDACQQIGMADMGEVIPRLSSAELDHAAARLERIERKQVPFSDVVMEEGYWLVAGQAMMLKQSNPLQLLQNQSAYKSGMLAKPGNLWESVRFALANKSSMLQANLNYFKALAKEQSGTYTGAQSRVRGPNNQLLPGPGMPIVVRARAAYLRPQAKLTVLKTEVALRRYNATNGQYPTSLTQLTPKYLKKVPIDPFGIGKPLRYKSVNSGKSFQLYSLGPDMVDNGGKPISNKSTGTSTSGDIVADHYD